MKKRLIALVLIVVMLTALIFTCVSCSTGIFSVDEERDYYEVIATVKYGDLSKDIYKGQLKSYINSYGATYQQNYNMTIDEIAEYFYNTLTRSALLSLYAKYYVYEKAAAGDADFNYVDTSKSISELSAKDFLTLSQYVYAIDETNDDFMSSYETLVDNLTKKEDEEEDEDTDEDALDPRTVRTYSDDDRSSYDADLKCECVAAIYGVQYENITYGDITESFVKDTLGEASVDAFIAKIDVFNVINAKIKAETDSTTKKNMKSALKTLKENISKSYSGYDWFLTDQLDSCIITILRNGLKDAQVATDAAIEAKYTALIVENIAKLDEDTYSSAMSGSTFLPVNASQDYTGVKSILLKFSDEQSAVLTALKAMYGATDDYVEELRDYMACGLTAGTILETMLEEDELNGIRVNISNAFYDSDVDKIDAAYTDKNVNFKVVLYCMANSIANITAEITDMYKDTDEYKALDTAEQARRLAIVEYAAKVEAFTQWTYLVNDDSGMFSSEAYTITPDNKASSYVEEFTAHARKLAQEDIGAYASSSYATGASLGGFAVNYTDGSEAYKVESKTAQVYVEEFTTHTKDKTLTKNVYTIVTEEGNTLSFDVNDYGIHIIMVTEKYGADTFIADTTEALVDGDNSGFKYKTNALYERGTTIKYDWKYTKVAADATFDANTKYYAWDVDGYKLLTLTAETFTPATKTYYTRTWTLTKVECEYKTLEDNLKESIIDDLFSTAYSASQIGLYLNIAEKETSIEKVDKVYEELIKEFES